MSFFQAGVPRGRNLNRSRFKSLLSGIGALLPVAALVTASCTSDFNDCLASRTCARHAAAGTPGDEEGGAAGAMGPASGGKAGHGDALSGGEGGVSGALGGDGGAPEPANGGRGGGAHGGASGTAGGGRTGSGGTAGAAGAGEGGGGGDATDGGQAGAPEGPDTTAPTILSVSPEDGATGVRDTADIVVTFSEPMDRVEAEKSYESVDLAASKVTFSWSKGGRELTVHPKAPLLYAGVGAIPGSSVPKTYTYLITTVARDVAGNQLADDHSFSFGTLRQLPFSVMPTSTKRVAHPATGADSSANTCGGDSSLIGDGGTDTGYALLLTFSLAGLPDFNPTSDLITSRLNLTASPIVADLGLLRVYRVSVEPSLATWSTPVLEEVASLDPTLTTNSIDVRDGVLDDLAHRNERQSQAQFLIHYDVPTDSDGVSETTPFQCAGLRLTGSYLAP